MMSGSKGAFAKPGSSKSTNLKSKNEIDSSIAYLQKYIKNEMCIYGIFYGNIVISSHPDQGVTVTLRPAIPISLRETPNAVKLRFLSVPTLKNTSNLVGE